MTTSQIEKSTEPQQLDNASSIAKTNRQGVFTMVNDTFAEKCGYAPAELIGANCSLLRHTDTPQQVFVDMWKTLESNRPWQGVIKNRDKNGDAYWNEVLIVPISEDQNIVGYLSVGSEPSPEVILRTEEKYRHLRQSGEPLRSSVSLTDFLSVKSGVTIGIFFVTLMMIIGGVLGISGLRNSNESIETIYRNQLKPALMIGRISFLMADNRSRIALALQDLAQAKVAGDPAATTRIAARKLLLTGHAATVDKNKVEIEEIWSRFVRIPQYEHEAALVRDYWQARQEYAEEGLAKAVAALQKGNLHDSERVFRERVNPLYDEAAERADKLLQKIRQNAEDELRLVVSRNDIIRDIALFGIVGGLLVVLVSGSFFLLGIVRPLDQAISHLERIASGDLKGNVEIDGGGETGRLSRALAIMQLRLRIIIDDIRHTSGEIYRGCSTLNELTMTVAERYEEQHDRLYQVITVTEQLHTDQLPVYANAETTLALAERLLAYDDEDGQRLLCGIRKMAAAVQLQTYINDDAMQKLNQVAALVVDNRIGAQQAWTVSEHLNEIAGELNDQVTYFN